MWGDGPSFNGWKMHIQKKGKRNHFFPTHLVFVWRAALKAILVVALSILFVISHYYETISFYPKQDVKKPHDKSLHFLVLHMYWCRKKITICLIFFFFWKTSSWRISLHEAPIHSLQKNVLSCKKYNYITVFGHAYIHCRYMGESEKYVLSAL